MFIQYSNSNLTSVDVPGKTCRLGTYASALTDKSRQKSKRSAQQNLDSRPPKLSKPVGKLVTFQPTGRTHNVYSITNKDDEWFFLLGAADLLTQNALVYYKNFCLWLDEYDCLHNLTYGYPSLSL